MPEKKPQKTKPKVKKPMAKRFEGKRPEAKKPPQRKPEQPRPEPQKPREVPREPPKPEPQTAKPVLGVKMLLFNRWDTTEVTVNDPGLKRYVNLTPIVVPRTGGKYGTEPIMKQKMSIVERFMNKLMVSGHRGKKHKLTSGRHIGKVPTLYKIIKEAFVTIEKNTKKNPVQVMVSAVENSALLEEVASYRLGGIIARNAVVTSPQRRLDLALRHLTQGIYKSSFRSKQRLASVISDELIAASNNDSKSFAVSERNRSEKEAEGAR